MRAAWLESASDKVLVQKYLKARSVSGSARGEGRLRRERARERATRTERADGSGARESVSGSPRGEPLG